MAVNKTIEINVKNNFKSTEKDLDGVNKELKETSAATNTVAASGATATASMDALGASKFTGLIASIGGVVKALFTLRGALMATGIGAFLVLLTSIKAAFTRSEEGQNKFAKIMAVIGSVVDNVLDVMGKLGGVIISAFENPVEAVKKLAKAIKDNIVNRITGMLELLPALGRAINEVFSGNFSKAGKIATDAVAKVTLGVEDFTDKIDKARKRLTAFIKEAQLEARITGLIADARAKADKIERNLLVERAKRQTQISELQLKSRQEEKFTEEQRMQFAKNAAKLTDQLLAKEEKALKIRFEAIKAENKLAESDKAALDAEAQAEAALINLKTRRLDAEKTATKFLNTLRDELTAKNKARRKVEEKATEFGVQFTKDMSNEEIAALTVAAEKKFKLKVKEGQDLIKTQDAQDKLRLELMDEGFEKELAKLVVESEARLAIAKDDKSLQLEIEADFIKKKEALEEAARVKKADDNEKAREADRIATLEGIQKGLEMAEKGAAAIQALGDAVFAHKMKDVEKGSKEEEKLARKQFKFNKALQLGGAVIDAGKAITASLAQSPIAIGPVPNPAGIASLAFAATTSAANIAKIAASKFESTGGGVDTPSPSISEGAQAPSFNVVGDSGVNQLAQLQQQPTQAFVVSGEVTTAQALDRNRVQNATL
jgi:hypothetical protein